MATCTRKKEELYLLGQPLKQTLTGNKLPSKGEVLRRFMHLHRNEEMRVRDAETAVVREVMSFWERARIPTTQEYNAINKLHAMFTAWQSLKKVSKRNTDTQKSNEAKFKESNNDLFDIVHANAIDLMKLEEDREFLRAQRERGRRGFMAGVDKKLTAKEARADWRKRRLEQLKLKCATDVQTRGATSSATVTMTSGSSDDTDSSYSETRPVVPRKRRLKKSKALDVVSSETAAALDRTRTSDRKAAYILSAFASDLGQKVQNLPISRSSIQRSRIRHRRDIAHEIRRNFSPEVVLTVHWDGKLVEDVAQKCRVDRLAVVVSGNGVSQLLGVPRIPTGTGECQAQAVYQCIEEWGIKNRIKALAFDTTASNTGEKKGACALLQQKFDCCLLHVACRHHMFEIVLEAVFHECMELKSSGPEIALFKRFQKQFGAFQRDNFQTVLDDEALNQKLEPWKEEIASFCIEQLQIAQPRDDYREMLELSLIILGKTPSRGIRIIQPGAMHRARWMARVIYSMKLLLFRQQFKLKPTEETGLRRFVMFALIIYIRAWYSAPDFVASPRHDVELLKKMWAFKSVDKGVSHAAIRAFSRHLWYISEELVGLAFFDEQVTVEEKQLMVNAMEHMPGTLNVPKRLKLEIDDSIKTKSVSDFVTRNTRRFFEILELPQSFLVRHPSTWHDDADFVRGLKVVRSISPVNDFAERGIALLQEFNTALASSEEQKQFLLQVVAQHRSKYPNPNKTTITGAHSSKN